MQKLLLKRTLRELQKNALRYLALFLLIVLSMFLIIGIVGSSLSIIHTVNAKAEANHLEDGEFEVFLPLEEESIRQIEAMGIQLEETFSLDFEMYDGSSLRVMKNRANINLIELSTGRLAEKENEIVLERLYAAAHKISVGDTISLAGRFYTVCGLATSADYDLCLQNLSDMSADGDVFGTAFVTPEAYQALLEGGQSLHTEDYRYSYLLSELSDEIQLKDFLSERKISLNEITDAFFQEMVHEKFKNRSQITDGVEQLTDGAETLELALQKLQTGSSSLNDGIQTIYTGLTKLCEKSGNLTYGSSQVLTALQRLETSLKEMEAPSSSTQEVLDMSSQLLKGIQELSNGLQLLEQVSYDDFEAALEESGMDLSSLSPDAQALLTSIKVYLDTTYVQMKTAADGAISLEENFQIFDDAIAQLPDLFISLQNGILELQNAIAALCAEYQALDDGIIFYIDVFNHIQAGFSQIAKSSETLSQGMDELAEKGGDFHSGMKTLQKETETLLEEYFPIEIDNVTDFISAEDNPRIRAANDDVEINIQVGLTAGVIVFVLVAFVVSVFVVHAIDRESSIIGALYALGLTKKQLMLHYTILPVLLCLIGGILGTLLGYSPFAFSILGNQTYEYFSIPEITTYYNPYLLIYGLLLPALVAFAINWLVIRKRLNQSALSLIRKTQAKPKTSHLPLKNWPFPKAFQLRQFLREKRSCFAVLAGMFISLLILILGVNCYVLCDHIQTQNTADTKYEYMYQLKYPEETIPIGGYPAYAENLSKEIMGYKMDVTLIGLTAGNPFFPQITSQDKDEISISSSMASKYRLQTGNEVLLWDKNKEQYYAFTIKEIVPYSVSLCCFMDIDNMRTFFGQDKAYYNVLYSDHSLDIEPGRLYSVTTKSDIEISAAIFMENMMPMIVVLLAVSILLFLIVLYQMTKVMIDRSSTSISLMKIFGYRNREIRMLYLDGNFFVIAAGALLLIPLAKLLIDTLYPTFVANVACGMDFSWSPLLYLAVYSSVLLCYLFIRTILVYRVNKINPAELLKNRE